jgi:hypothetical protein
MALVSVLMAKKATDDSGDRKPTTTARLPVELLRQARVVAAYRDIDLGAYLVALLEGPVARDYAQIVRESAKPKD